MRDIIRVAVTDIFSWTALTDFRNLTLIIHTNRFYFLNSFREFSVLARYARLRQFLEYRVVLYSSFV